MNTNSANTAPVANVRIRDIAPRYTFQAYSGSTSQKIELVDRLTAAGVQAVEVSNFVRKDLVPGLADAELVFAGVKRRADVSLECGIGNVRGLQRAIDAGAHAAYYLLSADEEFSRKNIGRTLDDALHELATMREVAERGGIRLGTYIISAFGGPIGQPRSWANFERIAQRLVVLDVADWIIADSFGYSGPIQSREFVINALKLVAAERLVVQPHDLRGLCVANVAAMVEVGLRNVDTALAGSGGHPAYADAQLGGVCTEDVAQLLRLMDVETGLDIDQLIDAANWLVEEVGVPAKGFVRHVAPIPSTPEGNSLGRLDFRWPGAAASYR